jgi:hypothetical protein
MSFEANQFPFPVGFVPTAEEPKTSHWFALFSLLLLLTVGSIVVPVILESKNRCNVSERLVKEEFSDQPLQIIDIAFGWSDKPGVFDVVKSFWSDITGSDIRIVRGASGKFTVHAQITESLYQSVDNECGLRELGITNLYEEEINRATVKFGELPVTYAMVGSINLTSLGVADSNKVAIGVP